MRSWIVDRHYTGSAPPGFRFALEFTLAGERVGGMLLGRPAARSLDERVWIELTRMYFVDAAPPNTESRALAMMRRFVRVWSPATLGLLAYSDPAVGHQGTIYLADGWAPFGRTSNGSHGWSNRPGRKPPSCRRPSRKIRWVRTP